MTDSMYLKLNVPCTILDKVREIIPTVEWKWVPWMTIAPRFPQSLVQEDAFLKHLASEFPATLRLYQFPSMTCYNWHRDTEMAFSLNMVLEEYRAVTLFNPSDKKDIRDDIVELIYEPCKWYLFNSQILHQVVNVDPRDRQLLTVTFPKVDGLTYDKVKTWLDANGYSMRP